MWKISGKTEQVHFITKGSQFKYYAGDELDNQFIIHFIIKKYTQLHKIR